MIDIDNSQRARKNTTFDENSNGLTAKGKAVQQN
jgi:hypothetical protein